MLQTFVFLLERVEEFGHQLGEALWVAFLCDLLAEDSPVFLSFALHSVSSAFLTRRMSAVHGLGASDAPRISEHCTVTLALIKGFGLCCFSTKGGISEAAMTPEEIQRLDHLCAQIKVEKDHEKFHALIREINELFQRKDERLGHPPEPKAS